MGKHFKLREEFGLFASALNVHRLGLATFRNAMAAMRTLGHLLRSKYAPSFEIRVCEEKCQVRGFWARVVTLGGSWPEKLNEFAISPSYGNSASADSAVLQFNIRRSRAFPFPKYKGRRRAWLWNAGKPIAVSKVWLRGDASKEDYLFGTCSSGLLNSREIMWQNIRSGRERMARAATNTLLERTECFA